MELNNDGISEKIYKQTLLDRLAGFDILTAAEYKDLSEKDVKSCIKQKGKPLTAEQYAILEAVVTILADHQNLILFETGHIYVAENVAELLLDFMNTYTHYKTKEKSSEVSYVDVSKYRRPFVNMIESDILFDRR